MVRFSLYSSSVISFLTSSGTKAIASKGNRLICLSHSPAWASPSSPHPSFRYPSRTFLLGTSFFSLMFTATTSPLIPSEAMKCPLLPPSFSRSLIPVMVILLEAALHMS